MAGGVNYNAFMTPEQRRIRAADGARMGDWAAANGRGLSRWPGIAYDYASTHTPYDMMNSVGGILADTAQSAWENPGGFVADMTPGLGEARSGAQADDLYAKIQQARAAGDEETASQLENLLPLVTMSAVPIVGGLLSPGKKLATEAVETAVENTVKGAAKKAAKGEAKRGILATPDLRTMTRDQAVATARPEPHLMKAQDGSYVGGPAGVTTPEGIQAMREAFDADVAGGQVGGNWYERARNDIIATEGLDPHQQQLSAAEKALWSAQANPDTNMGFALNARTDYEAGKPLDQYRTGAQARNYVQARDAYKNAQVEAATTGMMGHNGGPLLDDLPVEPKGVPSLGKKTGVYGQHLDPTVPYATTGTNDIWHARGFGYTNTDGSTFSRALTPQEHRFLDYETMLAVDRANATKLGGRDNWTAAEIQAAPWVFGKGRGISNAKGIPLEQGVAEAAKTYPDYNPKYTVSITGEQVPGKSTGFLPDLIGAPKAKRDAFSAEAQWADPKTGRHRLYADMKMSVQPTEHATGFYRNSAGGIENNAVEIGRPMTGFHLDENGNPIVNRNAANLFTTGQAVAGLLDMQEGSPWNKIITHGGGGDRTSLHVALPNTPDEAQMSRLYDVAKKYGFELANTDGGVAFLNFDDKATTTTIGKALRGDLGKAIEEAAPGAKVSRGRRQSEYVDLSNELSKDNAGQGLATKEVIGRLEALQKTQPDFYEKLLDSEGVAGKARENLNRLVKWGGKGQRPDYERLLKIVSEDKLRGLMSRVQKLGYQGLPAIGGAAVAGGLLGGGDPNER